MKYTIITAIIIGIFVGGLGSIIGLVLPYLMIGSGGNYVPSDYDIEQARSLRESDEGGWGYTRMFIGFGIGFLVGGGWVIKYNSNGKKL